MSETVTLQGPGNLGTISVVVTIIATEQSGGAYYNLDYQISGATPADAAKLCQIQDVQQFLDLPNEPGAPVSNQEYMADVMGGMVGLGNVQGLPKGAETNAPVGGFGAKAQGALTNATKGCENQLQKNHSDDGNFISTVFSDGNSSFTWVPTKPFSWPTFPSFSDPLVLDLQGSGLGLTPVTNSPVYFDFTGSGTATQTGWITPGEGFLLLNKGSGNLSQALLGGNAPAD